MEFDISGLSEITTLKSFKTDDGERLEQLLSGAGNRIAGLANQTAKASKELVEKIKENQKKLPGNEPNKSERLNGEEKELV